MKSRAEMRIDWNLWLLTNLLKKVWTITPTTHRIPYPKPMIATHDSQIPTYTTATHGDLKTLNHLQTPPQNLVTTPYSNPWLSTHKTQRAHRQATLTSDQISCKRERERERERKASTMVRWEIERVTREPFERERESF